MLRIKLKLVNSFKGLFRVVIKAQAMFIYQLINPPFVIDQDSFSHCQGIKEFVGTVGPKDREMIKRNINYVSCCQYLPHLMFAPGRVKFKVFESYVLG